MADTPKEKHDTKDDKEPVASPSKAVAREIPLDTRLLSESVIELNISRKNVGIYPPGHIQIIRSIDRAFGLLQKLFEIREEMTLGVAKDTLLVGQDYLDQQNPVYRDFALSLSQQEVAAITFIRGLDKEELVRFHRILTTKPDDIKAGGGIGKFMAEAVIPHIRVQTIDYTAFHLTEEQEILRPQIKTGTGGGGGSGGGSGGGKPGEKRGSEHTGSAVWQDFVSNLVSGNIATSTAGGVSLKDATQIDPAELARLLNERKLDAGAVLVSYDQIITDHVRGAAEKKLTKEQSATLSNLNALLKDLHPDLRKQFLSVAFKRISSSLAAEDIVGGFTDNMVIEMLEQASTEGREISPTLAGLIQNLTRVSDSAPVTPHLIRPKHVAEGIAAPDILPEHMQKLFNREEYEKYVSLDYADMLKRLSDGAMAVGDKIPIEEYEKTLEDDHLDFQIGRALLGFLEEDLDDDDYREFAEKVVSTAPQFLKSGNFVLLNDILNTIRRHTLEKTRSGVRSSANDSLKIFIDPGFREQAVASFDEWARVKGKDASSFLLALGSEVVPGLLDIYAIDTTPGGRRVLFDLLCGFGQATVKEAQKRLADPRAYYVRNLVMLIRWTGNASSIPFLKPLLKHPDLKVRMEALTALLKFKDPGALPLLRASVRSKDPDLSSQAISLAGQYRIAEVTEDILSMIKKVILFENDYTINEEIIKALGDIGDPKAIPELEKMAKATWKPYPTRFTQLKVALFESLGRYPREKLTPLLKIGEKMNVERIRKACRKIQEST